MNKIFYLLLLASFFSCVKETPETLESELENTFSEIKKLSNEDDGNFWGTSLYGPILFVNPTTRIFYANEKGNSEDFKSIGKIYTGTLPKNINIANTATQWDSIRWAMVMLPLPKEQHTRNNLLIHELFHSVQPIIGFKILSEQGNNHLDAYEGRLLLKLELEALKKALETSEFQQRRQHLTNALTFREIRQSTEPLKNSENSLEINEGLAEYTGVMLSGRSDNDLITHFIENINLFYHNQTFVRSFAYQTIPVYGYLLAKSKPNWQLEITNKTNLTDYFNDAFSIKLSEGTDYQTLATENIYHYQKIVEEEKERENQRLAKIEAYKKIFVERAILELPFRNMNISFDPRNITPLENYGTIYPNLRVTDDWGILTAEQGALISPSWNSVTVSEPTKINSNIVEGTGWKLELNKEWEIEKTGRSYKLKKK